MPEQQRHWLDATDPIYTTHHLRYLSVCCVALELSLRMFRELLKISGASEDSVDRNTVVKMALFHAAIVAYGRAFNLSQHSQDRRKGLSMNDGEEFDDTQAFSGAIHEQLITLRNKMVAHHDRDIFEPELLIREYRSVDPQQAGAGVPFHPDIAVIVHSVLGVSDSTHLDAIIKHVTAAVSRIGMRRSVIESLFSQNLRERPQTLQKCASEAVVLTPVELKVGNNEKPALSITEYCEQRDFSTAIQQEFYGITLLRWAYLCDWRQRRANAQWAMTLAPIPPGESSSLASAD